MCRNKESGLLSTWIFLWQGCQLVSMSFLIPFIRMSHWRHTMVDGAEFWISCKWPAFLSSFSCLQVIQNLAPSTIVWCQCDIKLHQLVIENQIWNMKCASRFFSCVGNSKSEETVWSFLALNCNKKKELWLTWCLGKKLNWTDDNLWIDLCVST